MRQINDHMKQVMGIQDKQPKPSFNPLKWNWTAIITWTVIGFISYNIFKFIINLIW
jgi:gentisate 1,2-dioxygenase